MSRLSAALASATSYGRAGAPDKACVDVAGEYARIPGGELVTLTQDGLSGRGERPSAGDFDFSVSGHTLTIVGMGTKGEVNGPSGSRTILWSNGSVYQQQQRRHQQQHQGQAAASPCLATTEVAPLAPHRFCKKFFVVPEWCDNCNGTIVGVGFVCSACGIRCHKGLGKGVQHCRGDLLMTACGGRDQGTQLQRPRARGTYELGDATRQILRDCHQTVKHMVGKGVVNEHRVWGKFEKVKAYVRVLRDFDPARIVHILVALQLCSLLAAAVIGALPTLLLARGCRISASCVQAAWTTLVLLAFELGSALFVQSVARKQLESSALTSLAIQKTMRLDLLEEMDIDLSRDAASVLQVADQVVEVTWRFLAAASVAYLSALLVAFWS